MFEKEPMQSLTSKRQAEAFFPLRFLGSPWIQRGQEQTGRAVGQRGCALEDVVNHGRGDAFSSPDTRVSGRRLALWLAGAERRSGEYALDPATEPSLFHAASIGSVVDDIRGDIRDYSKLAASLIEFAPELVFHLAAAPGRAPMPTRWAPMQPMSWERRIA